MISFEEAFKLKRSWIETVYIAPGTEDNQFGMTRIEQ